MPKTVQEWVTETGERPKGPRLDEWITANPQPVQDILNAIDQGFSWQQMNRYLTAIDGPKVHHETLRRALTE